MSAPSRKAALAAWGGAVATPLLFAGVTAAVAPGRDLQAPGLAGLFLWMSAAVVGIGIALARFLPPRIRARHQGSGSAVAFVRLLVAWAVLEGAAMFPLVAELATGSPWLYLPSGVAILALLAEFPSEERWSGQSALPPGGVAAARGGRP